MKPSLLLVAKPCRSSTPCGIVGGDIRPWKDQTFWAVMGSTNVADFDPDADHYAEGSSHAQCAHTSDDDEGEAKIFAVRCCADVSRCFKIFILKLPTQNHCND